MSKGTVVRILSDKGFGFIRPTGGDVEFFFHKDDVVDVAFDALREGVAVIFKEANSTKGPRARNVVIAR